jgi:hypothetical protein
VKFSTTGGWELVSASLPTDIVCGDVNGNGRDEIIGTWENSGVWEGIPLFGWYWEKFSDAADIMAAGDMDNDFKDDLVGVWSNGLWILFSSSMSWMRITPVIPNHIDTGLFRTGTWDAGTAGYLEPVGGYAKGPESLTEYQDFTELGPGGRNFVFREEKNLIPQETDSQMMKKTPGPGEPGIIYSEQKNLVPKEERGSGKEKEK